MIIGCMDFQHHWVSRAEKKRNIKQAETKT